MDGEYGEPYSIICHEQVVVALLLLPVQHLALLIGNSTSVSLKTHLLPTLNLWVQMRIVRTLQPISVLGSYPGSESK